MSKENKSKKIFRTEKDRNYTVIKNTIFLDERISWGAKGVLAYALTKPDDWDLYISEVVKRGTDKKEKVSRYFKELRQAGYFEYKRIYENGKIARTEYIISEQASHSKSVNLLSRYKIKKALEAEKLKPEILIQEIQGIEILSQEKTSLINTNSLLNTDINKELKERKIQSSYQEKETFIPNSHTKVISETLPETPKSNSLSSTRLIEIKSKLGVIAKRWNQTYIESSRCNITYEQERNKFESGEYSISFETYFDNAIRMLEKLSTMPLDKFSPISAVVTIDSLLKFNMQQMKTIETWYNKTYPKSPNVLTRPIKIEEKLYDESRAGIVPTYEELQRMYSDV